MSRRSRERRRKQRTFRWEGHVDSIDGDGFTAMLAPVDHGGPDVIAEFGNERLPGAYPGRLLSLYIHRRGRRCRHVLRWRVLRPWTEEELACIRARAHELAEALSD